MSLFDEPAPPPTAPSGPSVRVRLQLAYDGRRFHGFAAQPPGVRTVAGVLAGAIEKVLRLDSPLTLTCAGRTDAGVHARDQWVHVDLPAQVTGDLPGLQRRLVKLLGPEVVVRLVDVAPDDWDARFSAVSRTYRYTVLNSAVPDPFRAGFAWWVTAPLDLRAMQLACDPLIGEHDFSAFCRRQGDATLVRRVIEAGWDAPEPGVFRFEITANAFCQQMVRSVVGMLVDVGSGKRKAGDVLGIVNGRDRSAAGTVAPPEGLVLWEVRYPQ